jgi:membrane associated rhomboid family serine protease
MAPLALTRCARLFRTRRSLLVFALVFILAPLHAASLPARPPSRWSRPTGRYPWRTMGLRSAAGPTTTRYELLAASSRLFPTPCEYLMALPSSPRGWTNWEGDDVRWSTKLSRNWRRRLDFSRQPVRNTVILINIAAFIWQTVDTISWLRLKYPTEWPSQALSIVWDTMWGRSQMGPFTKDFVHASFLSQRQPHRLLTAGFLHGSLLHLVFNMDALSRQPAWLETGLGRPLYAVTFVTAIVVGNLAHSYTTLTDAFCLGASGGICGLYGLLYVCLLRMGKHSAAWRLVKGMAMLFGLGAFLSNVSNAGHAGGLLAGIVVGWLCGPQYRTSYALRRKNSLEFDPFSRDYRAAMGYDKVPSERGILPLSWLMVAAVGALLSQAKLRSIPRLILQGLMHPGSLLRLLATG